ncbi:MAG: peptidylprolyl isomerase [Bacteroidales bacterium]|nr:peptidylprolyl isomerase [Lentimicrobiaceae bacterium]MDD5694797.1 peptidylprolyl isomerase [Bacteroidales bacterium]
MKKRILINRKGIFLAGLIMGALSLQIQAQPINDDEVIVTIAGEKITKEEFLNIYTKNNVNNDVIDKKSLEDYLELYINFKLKVREAEDMGMDTVRSFIQELNGYRTQLAQPYLTDESVTENLIREAYERMQYDIRASHILIRIAPDAPPSDTLAAYQKIISIRREIMGGEDFGEMAVTYSDDPSSKDRPAASNRPPMKGNHGDLGYFTVFDMVYPFENGAFRTPVGEISEPVKTDFGYHLIKVTDKKKALGKVLVAHILITFPANASPQDSLRLKEKALQAYHEITSGKDFAEVAKTYSDDKGTFEKGGILPWFGVNRMIPEFIVEVSRLEKIDDVTAPFITSYGWHIVKLLDKKPIGTLEERNAEIKQKIARNDRANIGKTQFINKIKKLYTYREFPENLVEFYSIVNDSLLQAAWDPSPAKGMNKPLFSLDGKEYTQDDFAQYLAKNQKGLSTELPVISAVNKIFRRYTEDMIIRYEDSRLEDKYPDFRMLMKEYRDGILLFDLTDKKIWSKAIQDSVGLQQFYESNKQNYRWNERIDATIYSLTSSDQIKTVRKLAKKNTPKNDILSQINQDSLMILSIYNDKYERGDNEIADQVEWKPGMSDNVVSHDTTSFVVIHQILPAGYKLLGETRGIITADYQNYLEQEWIKELRTRYPVVINYAVLESIK